MKIFQILHGMCHWETPFKTLEETFNRFPTDCLFVEAPDYVTEQWGFNEFEVGDDRFIPPSTPEDLVMNDTTGTYIEESMLAQMLDEAKTSKLNESNEALNAFLDSHPITWTDGKQYGITKDDQTEINNALSAYKIQKDSGIENPILEWHAIGEAAVAWTYEDLQALYVAIYNESYKWYTVNQAYKTEINACDSIADVEAIIIRYETDEEKAEREALEAEQAAMEAAMNGEVVEEETATE